MFFFLVSWNFYPLSSKLRQLLRKLPVRNVSVLKHIVFEKVLGFFPIKNASEEKKQFYKTKIHILLQNSAKRQHIIQIYTHY